MLYVQTHSVWTVLEARPLSYVQCTHTADSRLYCTGADKFNTLCIQPRQIEQVLEFAADLSENFYLNFLVGHV